VPYGPPRHGERGADSHSHHGRLRRSHRSAHGEDATVVLVEHGCDAGLWLVATMVGLALGGVDLLTAALS
jgi:hypothetical protein